MTEKSLTWPNKVVRVAAFIVVVALSVFIFSIRDQAEQLAGYGYLGIFLLSFLAYATVLLPAPGVAVIFTMGAVFNPIYVGVTAGAGAALGEIVGYLAGYSGQGMAERVKIYKRLSYWMHRNGSLTVLILAAIPNPVFDLAGVVAGMLKMPVRRFLLFCWIGETIKMTLFAFAGSYSLDKIFT